MHRKVKFPEIKMNFKRKWFLLVSKRDLQQNSIWIKRRAANVGANSSPGGEVWRKKNKVRRRVLFIWRSIPSHSVVFMCCTHRVIHPACEVARFLCACLERFGRAGRFPVVAWVPRNHSVCWSKCQLSGRPFFGAICLNSLLAAIFGYKRDQIY